MREKLPITSMFFHIISITGIFIFSIGLYNILTQVILLNEIPATKGFLLLELYDIGICLLGGFFVWVF
jgi:hypothetical protein